MTQREQLWEQEGVIFATIRTLFGDRRPAVVSTVLKNVTGGAKTVEKTRISNVFLALVTMMKLLYEHKLSFNLFLL
jgi:hypothetical protein